MERCKVIFFDNNKGFGFAQNEEGVSVYLLTSKAKKCIQGKLVRPHLGERLAVPEAGDELLCETEQNKIKPEQLFAATWGIVRRAC